MLNNIGHAVMDVSNELKTLKKEIHVIKVDVMKNQEILNSLAENDRRTVSSVDTRQVINRASLKIPVQTISELNEIEEDEDKLSTLARILQRDARSFDAKRTTYMAMKLIMQNRVAEFLNMEGRGDKTAFVKYKIYTTVIDCVKDIFPIVSLIEIKGHISDWLKQAPRRK
ncbi:unnamed protein product [Macrosiphum euphorbiae]|uniref:DUF4806 domain-containing protein n=1 Tax=Macrosiphum euphorbiae TaxID=13131 RepID=A0AAV0Y4R9_9HEMI|nr:unnamed protein product [Macrosiphum euphorbiae]